MPLTSIYYVQRQKGPCAYCGTSTRGVVVFDDSTDDVVQLCPRCRDTHSAFKHATGRDRKLYNVISKSAEVIVTNVPADQQLPPMLCRGLKDVKPKNLIPQIMGDKKWLLCEKHDGVRALMYFIGNSSYFLSRNLSVGSGQYADKSDNLGHLQLNIPEFDGTVLDGELLFSGDYLDTGSHIVRSKSTATSAIVNAGPLKSKDFQNRFGKIGMVVFDILKFKGTDVRSLPFGKRRQILQKIMPELIARQPLFSIETVYIGSLEEKERLYFDIIQKGGEGVVYKDVTSVYSTSATSRPVSWVKRKKRQTTDAFISDFIPGDAGFRGLVGALVLSVYDANMKPVAIASVSNLPLSLREEMSNSEGGLKDSYYGQVVEVSFQELTEKSVRGRHAVLEKFRPDRNKESCTIESLTMS